MQKTLPTRKVKQESSKQPEPKAAGRPTAHRNRKIGNMAVTKFSVPPCPKTGHGRLSELECHFSRAARPARRPGGAWPPTRAAAPPPPCTPAPYPRVAAHAEFTTAARPLVRQKMCPGWQKMQRRPGRRPTISTTAHANQVGGAARRPARAHGGRHQHVCRAPRGAGSRVVGERLADTRTRNKMNDQHPPFTGGKGRLLLSVLPGTCYPFFSLSFFFFWTFSPESTHLLACFLLD